MIKLKVLRIKGIPSGAHLPPAVTGACLPSGKRAFGEYLFCNALEVHKLEKNRKASFGNKAGFFMRLSVEKSNKTSPHCIAN
ncbi:hypothetical protein OB69_03605 [Roseivirga seohaensis subsp. aquiponti]|uniref:Uncharacterized protein n=1 Tax=Roseivirga seohaensis subsp. aquiponti TaxID=1566026 RepID=A0A0L8AP37_9BACT|nr:hypothetical protein [Roseivirga seohaensis]KOF04084.1 hypothetical protein OB69_03605 [Roseivirga seohaensis subsp. aquiponti]